MEVYLAFTLHLSLYQEGDLRDYITFMMSFRTVLNSLKHSEVIELETVYAVIIIDLQMQVLPDHEPHDVSWFEPYSYFEPADLDSDYIEQEAAKGKGTFIQAQWTQHVIPKLYGLVYKAWRQYGAQNLTTWTQLAQAVLNGCFGRKWPDSVFQVPDSCYIFLSTNTLAREDALWSCVSLALPPTTPGRKQLLPPLQNTQPTEGTLDTVMSPRKMGELLLMTSNHSSIFWGSSLCQGWKLLHATLVHTLKIIFMWPRLKRIQPSNHSM
ncbi:hypothetical protein TNCV_3187691 [Trichonephila clavipes]|nr:hypothetical protein TNCV_3187691 [Trichonephila clavipes]